MFKNLEVEITRGNYKKADIANYLGITPSTFSSKLKGKYPLSLIEVVKIKEFLCVDIPIEILFDVEQPTKAG